MPRETQNRILRVLVDQTFQRVGGTTKVSVDVRIISSTARNLEVETAEADSAKISITGYLWFRSECLRCAHVIDALDMTMRRAEDPTTAFINLEWLAPQSS